MEDSVKDSLYTSVMDGKEKKLPQEVLVECEKELDGLLDTIIKCTEKKELLEYIYEVSDLLDLMDDLTLDEDWGLDYAAFEDLIDYNHTAFLYVLAKYLSKNERLKELYHGVLGRDFVRSIAKAYQKIICNKKYEQSNNREENSVWYRNLFEELFVNDILKVNKATRIDALNFYDAYITYTE